MKHKRLTINLLLILLLVMVTFPKSAIAQTIYDTYPSIGQVTNGWCATAQTITAPSESYLTEYRWILNARTTPGSVKFAIYEWQGGPSGPALYETYLAWDTGGDYEVSGINLQLTEGTLYGMVIDTLGYCLQSVHFTSDLYSGGNGYWSFDVATGTWVNYPGYDHVFRAVFEPSNQPPTANPNGPYLGAINTLISFDGTSSYDPDNFPQTLTHSWTFGDGDTSDGSTPSHSFATPGIYDVCLIVNDGLADSEKVCTTAVVYDPSGGFVTGGGWIDSPEDAYKLNDLDITTLVWNQGFDAGTDGWFGGISRNGDGTATAQSGDYSRFDGYRSTWPGTWIAEIDIYLDPAWPANQGFDYSVAASGSDGAHQRDYIFHVGTVENYGPIVGKELLIAVDNNAYGNTNPYVLTTRPGGYYVVPAAGWYTFQHVFYDAGGYLAVDFNVLDSNGGIVWSDTNSNLSDTIPEEVGGNRYAWFVHIDVTDGIQIDNHQLFIPVGPTGKATFGFVSKYKKGADTPDDNTEFQFKAGDLNFQSTSYEWLVVTGSDFAKFKGEGTINGQGNYKFQIWAGDDSPDTFRIKIWYEDNGIEVVIYDNGMNQPISGGNIVVHNK